MIRANINGDRLSAKFRSYFVKNSIGKKVRETNCSICRHDDRGASRIAMGVARQNSKDNDCKKRGQQEAFSDAVIKGWNKEDREVVRKAFGML